MKLSDAILLGATITEPKPYDINHCALGMAANAMGFAHYDTQRSHIRFEDDRFGDIQQHWPWIHHMYKGTSCWNWIADTFNTKVCPLSFGIATLAPTMTLEELVAEVRVMEEMYDKPSAEEIACDAAASELSTGLTPACVLAVDSILT